MNKIIAFLFCFIQLNLSYSQTDSMFLKNVKDNVFLNNNEQSIDSSLFDPVIYYHYDSLKGLLKDSIVYKAGGYTVHYHYVEGKQKIDYTYYHESGLHVAYDITKKDTIAVFDIMKFTDIDTMAYLDTIRLYYHDSGAINYYSNNITLEALNEDILPSVMPNNLMRFFLIKFEEDDSVYATTYTISDILQDSLKVIKKTGMYLDYSLRSPIKKKNIIEDYHYETSYKIIKNRRIKKIIQKIIVNDLLFVDKFVDDLVVEYIIDGKYYYLTSSYESLGPLDYFPPKMRKTLKLIKKLIIYIDNYL
jgi:hypothetical protein